MTRIMSGALALILSFLAVTLPSGAAQDPAKKNDDKTAKKANKDDKTPAEGVKISQTKPYGSSLFGKVKKADEKMLTLELPTRPKPVEKEFEVATDVKVRVPPEPEFDAKGKPVKFKPDRKDPDRSLGGVKGGMSDVHEGATVEVRLGRYGTKKDMKLIATTIIVRVDVKK